MVQRDSVGTAPVYRFNDFSLDTGERQLSKDGRVVALTPKAFDLLVYFVEHPGRLIEKATLLEEVWPDVIVEEANLAFQVSALRKALDEGARGESLIQTVPTKGYRFVAPVTRDLALPQEPEAEAPDGAALSDADPRRVRPGLHVRRSAWVAVSVGLVVVASVVVGYRLGRGSAPHPGSSGASEPALRLVPVTTLTGRQDWPSFSPDGTQIAFEWSGEQDDNADIYVALIGSPDVRRLTSHPGPDYAPAWSPDGRVIAFLRAENGVSRIHLMSALGGPDRVVSDFPAYGKISWSPDGRYVVAGRVAGNTPGRGIYLVPVSGAAPRPLVSVPLPAEAHAPAFSPDGRRVAFARCDLIETEGLADASMEGAEEYSGGCQAFVVSVNEQYVLQSSPQRLTRDPMTSMGALAWSRDGGSIVFWAQASRPAEAIAEASADGMNHLWRVAGDGMGKTERLEIAGMDVRRPATTPARDRLVFCRLEQDLDVFRFSPGHAPQRVVTSAFPDGHASFSPDGGSIAFSSARSGGTEIWIARSDGEAPRQLTHDAGLIQGSATWSPDGRTIAFDAQDDRGDRQIWTIRVEGGAPRRLTSEHGEQSAPTWSHDGRWVYYTRGHGDERNVWRVSATGGTPEQVSRHGSGVVGYESADGRHVVYKRGALDTPLVEAALDGTDERILVDCVTSHWGFSVIGNEVYYMPCGQADPGTVRVLDRRTGRDRVWGVVPNGKDAVLWNLAISPDGTSLLFDRWVNLRANLWMLENFK